VGKKRIDNRKNYIFRFHDYLSCKCGSLNLVISFILEPFEFLPWGCFIVLFLYKGADNRDGHLSRQNLYSLVRSSCSALYREEGSLYHWSILFDSLVFRSSWKKLQIMVKINWKIPEKVNKLCLIPPKGLIFISLYPPLTKSLRLW